MVKPGAKPAKGQRSLFSFFSAKKGPTTTTTPTSKKKNPNTTPTQPRVPNGPGSGGLTKHTPVDKAIDAASSNASLPKTSLFAGQKDTSEKSAPPKQKQRANKPLGKIQHPQKDVAAPVKRRSPSTSSSNNLIGTTSVPTDPEDLVGMRVKVYWEADDDHYPGVIDKWNDNTQLHHITYDDGEVSWIDMHAEEFEVIGQAARKQRSGDPTSSSSTSRGSAKKKKSRRQIEDDESSEEEEYVPGDDLESDGDDTAAEAALDVLDEEEADEEEEAYSPPKKTRNANRKKARATPSSTKSKVKRGGNDSPFLGRLPKRSPFVGGKAKASGMSGASSPGSAVTDAAAAAGESAPGVLQMGCHAHNKYKWLYENRRDKHGRRPGEEGFDERTLLVPRDFMKKQTPAQAQWWEIKSDNMDAILFFKVGKFYEIFNQDADVAIRALNGTPNAMVYMKGEKAHCGFPEKAYGKFAELLVEAGLRVLRVEQVETPQMLKARNAASGVKDKCVRREIVSLMTKGTRTMGVLEQNHSKEETERKASVSRAGQIEAAPTADLLMSLRVKPAEEDGHLTIGFCVVDASIGLFQFGQFHDSASLLADFRVLLVRFQPREIAFGANLPDALMSHIRDLQGVVLTKVPATAWSAEKLVETLAQEEFFGEDRAAWPDGFRNALDRGEAATVAFEAVGGALHYLHRCLIDVQLVSQRKLFWYDIELGSELHATTSTNAHLREATAGADAEEEGAVPTEPDRFMQLDSEAIQHLELVRNNDDGSERGTVLGFINHCVTAFGKRQLQQWVLFPLFSRKAIIARQVAIRNLMALQDVVDAARQKLRKLPDLERLLSRNHTHGSEYLATQHPVGRAIMYENPTYNATKIKNFVQLLRGFRCITQVARTFENASLLTSPYLRALTSTKYGFPELKETLDHFESAFDHNKALSDGFIVPKPGFDDLYDDCVQTQKQAVSRLHQFLAEMKNKLNCNTISFIPPSKKNAYQLEIPESRVGRSGKGKKGIGKLPTDIDWEFKGHRKGWERYTTPRLNSLIAKLQAADEAKQKAVLEITRRMFERFDRHAPLWLAAVKSFTTLDCLMSLMLVSKLNEPMCCPTLLPSGAPASIKLVASRHPCVAETFSGDDFVPNDVTIGADGAPSSLLLTGPNMGGKSTLLRQVATCVILAQIGCYVPAESATMALTDRVFTRLGANDDIMAQKSTFFIELSETAKVLKAATPHSLVILDELGRGTSTFDGAAIATSVLSYLTSEVKCATLFSTHYHNLVEQFAREKVVGLGHMDFLTVEPEEKSAEGEQEDEDVEQVVFLYKLVPGACPKSFGMNVARLADLPIELIRLASQKSRAFEAQLKGAAMSEPIDDDVDVARSLLSIPDDGKGNEDELVRLWAKLQIN